MGYFENALYLSRIILHFGDASASAEADVDAAFSSTFYCCVPSN